MKIFGIALLFMSGCCASPWSRYPRKQRPDLAYSLGGGASGYDVYVWSCLEGKKTVVFQYTAEMSCQAAQQELAPCGEETAFERAHHGERHAAARESRAWR